MSDPTPRTTKALIGRIQTARDELEGQIAPLSEAELTRPGPEGWSVKDHLAHLALWRRSLIALLEGTDRAAAVGLAERDGDEDHDIDAINARLYANERDRPLAEVLADFRATHRQALDLVARLSDEDLTRPYSHYQPQAQPRNEQPVVGWIAGNTYEHDAEHAEWIKAVLKAR